MRSLLILLTTLVDALQAAVDQIPEHVCADEVMELAGDRAPNGSFTVTERCGVCGVHLGSYQDSVL